MQVVGSVERLPAGFPTWLQQDVIVTNGRDPLSLESITINRIVPLLTPGILALSRRARYLSLHTFLVDHFREHRLGTSNEDLSRFIKRAELEFAIAVRLCRHAGCGAKAQAVVGDRAARRVMAQGSPYRRDESVDSALGGYGLYYRSPLIDLGLVASRGTVYDGKPLAYDRLANQHARALAAAFRTNAEHTEYFRSYLRHDHPIPEHVLQEYSEHVCLCRLPEMTEERDLLQTLLFGEAAVRESDARDRRRSFGLTLRLIGQNGEVADDVATWRHEVWEAAVASAAAGTVFADTAARWAALVAKEYIHEGLATLWSAVCQWGIRTQPTHGSAPADFHARLKLDLCPNAQLLGVSVTADMFTGEVAALLADAAHDTTLEELRVELTNKGALGGLALILLLNARLPDADAMPEGWRFIGRQDGDHQPGLLGFTQRLRNHLSTGPRLADTLDFLVWQFVVLPHNRIATGKLPYFTFRFRFDGGRIRFYRKLDISAFGVGDGRYDAIRWLSQDLGLWEATESSAQLTERGQEFVADAFR